ncbi:MAG TPA: ATP-binding protein [Terriglobales bacterium]|nr:ATP-binding protein [Terriglobales bacterium]
MSQSTTNLLSRARAVAAACGAYAVFAGIITLIGWAAEIPRLTSWKNDGIAMFPNTALCSILGGLSLLLRSRTAPEPRHGWRRVSASLLCAIGALTLSQHLTGINLGIDTLLFHRNWGAAATAPMRMGPPASLSFLLIGTALLLLEQPPRRGFSAKLGVAVVALATLSLTGHLYGAEPMYTIPQLTAIAMQTGTVVLALAIGIVASVPEREPMRTLLDGGAAGMLARRAVPIIVVLSVSIGFLRVSAQKYGLVDTAFGSAGRTVVELLLIIGSLWWTLANVRTQERARRASEAEMQRQADELASFLEQSNQRKDEFIAILAHELRNPLAPMRNAAHYLKLKGSIDAQSSRAVSMIERQVMQMSRLVDDLLDVARISRGMLEIRRQRVWCHELIDAALDACGDELRAKGHELHTTLPSDPVEVWIDRERMVQVLCNLLGNAAKYTLPRGRIELVVAISGDTLTIDVKDNGVGIPADKVHQIFELFARVDRALDDQGGLGIGLTLAQQIIRLHGGTIEAFSRGAGCGTEMRVRVPVNAPPTAATVAPAQAGAPGAPKRILLADDNQDAVESLALLLQIDGHEVHTVFDGESAIASAERIQPQVVLLDIGMPKANGYEVARRIRHQQWGKQMYLVALTGWGQEGDKQRAREAGFDAHLVKPVPPDTLQQLLAGIAPAKAPRAV